MGNNPQKPHQMTSAWAISSPLVSPLLPRGRPWVCVIRLVVLTGLSLLGCSVEASLDRESLELVWFDNFVGESLDWDKWIVDTGDGCDIGLCDWGNGEQQYYRSENAAVVDGNLIITGKQEEFASRFYTSSKVVTRNKYAFRYGKAEARIKLSEGGEGLWPAFWMMPQDNKYGAWAASGEIDIFESRNDLTEVFNNLNFGSVYPNNTNYNGDCFTNMSEGTLQEFHTYAVEWDEEEFVWLMDDEETCRQTEWYTTNEMTGESKPKPAPFDQEFYLVLNMAIGGNSDFVGKGLINDSALPATMHVDWVRVYQTPEDFGEGPESVYLGNAVGGGSRQGVLLWGDDFNGTEPSADWEIVQGEACLGVETLCDFEVQGFQTRATRMEGGIMSLEAGADELTEAGVVTAATAGMVHTNGSFDFTYGRLEVNLSAPEVPGVVSTVSLLADGGGITRQIQVISLENGMAKGGLWFHDSAAGARTNVTCEALPPFRLSSTSASGDSSINSSTSGDYKSSLFYTFAVEWTEDRFRWYADGRQYCEIPSSKILQEDGSWPFDEAMYVAMGVAVGRSLDGKEVSVNHSDLPVYLYVGSVRAHRFVDMEGTPIPSSATKYVREGNLTWQDEFDGVELAGDVRGLEYWWQHEEGDGCEMGICGFGNGEAQWYRQENTAVVDGKLVMTAKAEAYAGNIFTSAKLSTNSTVIISYGRIEVRVKLPSAQGLWPSIWMLPQDSPYGGWASSGAIDILQARNHMARAHGQLIFGGEYPNEDNLDLYQGGHCFSDLYDDFSQDYHVFALEWEEDAFRWYVDGILYCDRNYWYSRPGTGEKDYPFPAPFDTGFYLLMNVAVGGSFTGGLIDEDALADNPEMLVDYVRVYTLEGQSVFVVDPPEASSDGSGLSPVTAVSVLIALGIFFAICLIGRCVVSIREKYAKREQGAGANTAAADSEAESTKTDSKQPPSRKRPIFASMEEGAHTMMRVMTPVLPRGADSETGNCSSNERRRTSGVGIRFGGGVRVTPTRRSPRARRGEETAVWGRAVGADENRVDVTPARLAKEAAEVSPGSDHRPEYQEEHRGGSNGGGGVWGGDGDRSLYTPRMNLSLSMMQLVPPSVGAFPSVSRGEVRGGRAMQAKEEAGIAAGNGAPAFGGAAWTAGLSAPAAEKESSSSGSVQIVVEEGGLASRRAAALALRQGGNWKGSHNRVERFSDWSSTGSGGSRSGYLKSESICSDDDDRGSDLPPQMPGMTQLDFASRDEDDDDGQVAPPSYSEVALQWRRRMR